MRLSEFVRLFETFTNNMASMLAIKGSDYSGNTDCIANFRTRAAELDLSMEKVWAVFAGKHYDAIMNYCRKGQVESEPIEGRLIDLANYCVLLAAIIKDNQEKLSTNPVQNDSLADKDYSPKSPPRPLSPSYEDHKAAQAKQAEAYSVEKTKSIIGAIVETNDSESSGDRDETERDSVRQDECRKATYENRGG